MPKTRDLTYPPAPEPLPIPVVDNHTHIEPGQGPRDAWLDLADQLARAAAAGVAGVVQCGCDLEAARWTARTGVLHPGVLGAIALHPNDAPRLQAGGAYESALGEIAELARAAPRVRAIGETGLDYYRTGPEGHAAQIRAFRDHIALAKELGLALQIHDRDAHRDVIAVLERDGAPDRTVFHCFSGDRAMAELAAARGWFVSVAGTVTFASNASLREAVGAVPLGRLLVETDAPYLTPHPHRGRPNAPYLIPWTVRAIAETRGEDLELVCQTLANTARSVYGSW
jgi:TatD DNase family protein